MDAAFPAASAQPFAGEVDSVFGPGPAADDPGLLIWSNDGDEGLLSSLESGGALMNPGGWSISTAPGEEGLRWNAVKMEVFDEWAGPAGGGGGGGAKQSNPLQPRVLPGTTKTKAGPSVFPDVVKADPEEGWAELMSPPSTRAWPPSAADGFAAAAAAPPAASAATTPISPPACGEVVQPLAPAPGGGGGQSVFFCFQDFHAFSCEYPGGGVAPLSRSSRDRWRRADDHCGLCSTSRKTLVSLLISRALLCLLLDWQTSQHQTVRDLTAL